MMYEIAGRRKLQGGFTLLEVMAALTIMAMSLIWILKGQTDSMARNVEMRLSLQAVHLANYKLLETEQVLRKEGFGTFDGEACGDFAGEGLFGTDLFRYCVFVERILLPDMGMFQQQVAGGLGLNPDVAPEEAGMNPFMQDILSQLIPGDSDIMAGLAGMMGDFMGMALSAIQNVMEQGVRRVRVEVYWQAGKKFRSFELVGFLTDPDILDQNIMDLTGLSGAGATDDTGDSRGGTTPVTPGRQPSTPGVR